MLEYVLIIILLILVFILVWWFIGKYPERIAKTFPFIRERDVVDSTLHVFSAETPDGKEAEFIDEQLPAKNKFVRFFRTILIAVYFLIIAYLIFARER